MNSGRFLLAVILMIAVVVVTNVIFPPAPRALPGLFSYRLRIGTREIDLARLPFSASASGLVVLDSASGPRTLTLQHTSDTVTATVAYTFHPTRYAIDVRMNVRTPTAETPSLAVQMPHTLAINEAVRQEDERALAYVVNSQEEGISSARLRSIKAQRLESGPLSWVAVKNKYFVAAALMDPEVRRPFAALIAEPVGRPYAARMLATGMLPGPDGNFAFRLYAGPLEPAQLEQLGYHFEDVNPFGWRLFLPVLQPLGHGIAWVLYGIHNTLGLGYGWVLILFGVLIRIVLWPLNAKAMRSQLKTMQLQPKVKELQAKFKNDPQRMQQEMIRLYREEGFNPMGGCLPMLIPLPILITLFFVFQSTIAFRGVQFLWLPDLSRADPFFILPVLLGISMFLMQWLSTHSTPNPNPQMKFLMYFMPIFMTVLFLRFASGLNLYYTAMNVASIPQQLQIVRERKRLQTA